MADNNSLVFYQQGAVAGLQMDKYSTNPGCVDSKNLDIFSDSQSVKAMAWTDKEVITNEWVDIDPKERFYLAADGRVWDSQEEVWYDHSFFDANANLINYSDGHGTSQAVFGTPKKLFVAYDSEGNWKTITIITDRLVYNIYSDWVHIAAGDIYGLRSGEPCTREGVATGNTTVMTIDTPSLTGEWNSAKFASSGGQMEDCPGGFHTEPDRSERFMRLKMKIKAHGGKFKSINLSAWRTQLYWDQAKKEFDENQWNGDMVFEDSIESLASGEYYTTEDFYFDNYIEEGDYYNSRSGIYIHASTDYDSNCSIRSYFYKKEDWQYLYPKDRNFMEIEDETYMEGLDTTEYVQLYYDSEEDLDGNVYYQFMAGNVLDYPDGYNIVAFARAFDYQYIFVNKGDMGIIYYATDVNLAAWERGFRFPGMQFVNAIMIGQYVYVIAEERGVRGLYVYYNGDMKKLVGADMRYTEGLNLIDGKEKYNFNGIMVNWRNNVVCATKDAVFMRGRNRLGSNVGTFILNTEGEIVDIKTERGRLDVYFTIDQTKYRKTFQDDVNIRRYEPEFEIVYPVQINSHILEKEPLKLAVSYDIPNIQTSMDVYLSVNDYHYWSFLTDGTVEPEVGDKFKVSGLSGDYWLIFVEKNGNWLTFTLDGDLPYQSSNTMNLVSEDTEVTILFSDFNHFKKIGTISKTSPQEKIGKHTLLNISNGNDLPIVRKAQVKIVGKTDNHVSPLLYDVRLLSNQYDK